MSAGLALLLVGQVVALFAHFLLGLVLVGIGGVLLLIGR